MENSIGQPAVKRSLRIHQRNSKHVGITSHSATTREVLDVNYATDIDEEKSTSRHLFVFGEERSAGNPRDRRGGNCVPMSGRSSRGISG